MSQPILNLKLGILLGWSGCLPYPCNGNPVGFLDLRHGTITRAPR